MLVFQSGLSPEQQAATLARINTWAGVSRAACLKPEAKDPDVRRLCYAYVEDDADVAAIADRLAQLPEVESASVPAERRLI
jgi:hypothetical protein